MTSSASAPILSLAELSEKVAGERARGTPIILTNGCFDLLHAGHIRYLTGAKAIGGFLIAAINSDRRVTELKGPGRPFINEDERAEIIAALRPVDAVVVFDDATVENIILAIKPDFHAKGTDYTEDTVPEREIVRRGGGRVVIVGDPKDHSSTELIERAGKA
ncbi:MAG: adenylyltransferase/cytidyltransferase family protein [Acidobacteriota bacterium]